MYFTKSFRAIHSRCLTLGFRNTINSEKTLQGFHKFPRFQIIDSKGCRDGWNILVDSGVDSRKIPVQSSPLRSKHQTKTYWETGSGPPPRIEQIREYLYQLAMVGWWMLVETAGVIGRWWTIKQASKNVWRLKYHKHFCFWIARVLQEMWEVTTSGPNKTKTTRSLVLRSPLNTNALLIWNLLKP